MHLAPFSLLVAALVVATPVVAQCSNVWLPGDGLPGTSEFVRATTVWDPDGAGPLPAKLVAAGDFTVAGTVAANRIAVWDLAASTWSSLGIGMNGIVRALVTMPNGDLVAGGDFTTAGGVPANRVARWDGTAWSALGTGLNGEVDALTVRNGDLVAGGFFTTAGGTPANRIARWNGAAWSALGTGMDLQVQSLTTLPNGDLIAGGAFTTAGGVAASRIARWNGTAWFPLGPGVSSFFSTSVLALHVLANGDLIVGGNFLSPSGVSGADFIARWNGAAWSALLGGGSPPVGVRALTTLPNGDLIAATSSGSVRRWNGAGWSAVGGEFEVVSFGVHALATLPNGDLIAGGDFRNSAGGLPASRIARWNGTAWSALGTGFDSDIRALATLPNGDLVAGGLFKSAGGVPARRVARWNGTAWAALGSGIGGASAGEVVNALTSLPNGDLVAGGVFTTAGGAPANYVARWNGAAWSALGLGCDFDVLALTTLANGDMVAGGRFALAGGIFVNRIARWNGTAWSLLGTSVNGSAVRALTTLPNGDLIAGGDFTTAGGVPANRIARWNGTAWSAMGAGFNIDVMALTTLPNGDLVAGGIFNNSGFNKIARWNGTSWSAMGTGLNDTVNALAALPNGDLVVGGLFTTAGGVPASRIARWNGTSWSAFGTGLDSTVSALRAMPSGELVVGGEFLTANGAVSPYLARLSTTCPATSAPYGAGCASSGGSNTLVASTPPWVDAQFRASGTGLPTNAIVLTLTSVTSYPQAAVPLTLAFPQAGPGCDLLVNPDILGALVTTNGTAESSFFLPNTPPLVGVTFYHQMMPIELDGLGNWVAVTATNALQLTAGAF